MKKILVRAPKGKDKAVLVFPFLHLIRTNYSDGQIDIICERDDIELYEMVDVNASIHYLPGSKQTLSGIHHYCYNNSDVFNIDMFFDLTDTFKGSFLGMCFRSRERVGFDRGLKSILINKKKHNVETLSLADRYIALLEDYNKINLVDYSIKQDVRSNQNILSLEIDPYILIISKGFSTNVIWGEMIELLSDVKVIVWDQDSETRRMELASMNIPKDVDAVVDSRGSLHDLVTLSAFSKVVVTDIDWIANFISYKGSEVILFKDRNEVFQTSRFYHSFPKTVYQHDGIIDKVIIPSFQDEIKNKQQLVDYIYSEFIK